MRLRVVHLEGLDMLYKQQGSQYWYVKLKKDGGVIRKSTRETDKDKAMIVQEAMRKKIHPKMAAVTMTGKCSVYVICPEDGLTPCKIGLSKRPRGRLSGLQTSHFVTLMLYASIQLESIQEATAVEAALHEQLKGCRVRGEWFDLTASDAEEFLIREAAKAA